MANWLDFMLDWISSMSESGLNKRIEEIKKEIDWLNSLSALWGGSPTDRFERRDEARHRLSKLLKKRQKREKLYNK